MCVDLSEEVYAKSSGTTLKVRATLPMNTERHDPCRPHP
ncbi:hypothetical protein SBA5_290014 [Candidatus Sulfotelmatomonas gaucii]|uniref:Uncharacterized protein n=1 Tax=Candidatus Sulfuritelmatomonas gaucii TaxID=2043161 RepID=A0A2N9LA85_9BACT|nr:hypothetical protein SBA5_290014 [Candidatus Sulfotelmatomonas gaucii]